VPLIVKTVRLKNTTVKLWVFVLLLLMAIIKATFIHVSNTNCRFSQVQVGHIVNILKQVDTSDIVINHSRTKDKNSPLY